MFNQYPYINLNDLNLDYILKAIKEMRYEVTNFVSINAIKYANPIQWNITSQYEKNTIVIDPVTGTAYISVAPVPAGVALTRPEYWTVVFDLGSFVTRAAQNFTSRWESETTTTATFASNTGDWLVWGDVLYKALSNIIAGDTYVVGSNIEHFTIEELYASVMQLIADNYDAIVAMIGDLDDLTTTAKNNIVAAVNELVAGLSDEVRARQDADGTLQDNIDAEVRARQDADIALQSQIDVLLGSKVIIDVSKNGVVGDGSTDNTNAIQTLLNDNAGVGALYFPSGTYLTGTLTIPSNTVIWLDGTLKLKDGANAQLLYALTKENITIFGIGALDGNKANQNSNLAISCILFGDATDTQYNVNNVLIEGITIKNSLYWGACVIGDNCTFKDVTFADNEYMSFIGPHSKHGKFLNCVAYGVTVDWGLGFYGGVDDGIIDGCIAYNNHQTGLGALSDTDQPTPSNNIIITNCYCYNNGGVGIAAGGWTGLGYDFIIANNICKNNGLTIPSIYDCGGIYISFMKRATIANNSISGNDGANDYGAGIILVGECTHVEIANNSIVSNNYGVLLTGAAMVGININNNNIRGAEPVNYTGVTACVDNIINSNIFDANAAPYIPFNGDAAIHVKDNLNYKTCVYGRISFPVDGVQSTFVITPALIGLKGNIANCIITPKKDYGETPLIDKGQALINITYTTAPPAGLGTIEFDYVITSDLY